MPSASDASAIPAEGQDLVVLADVKEVLHVRVFDSDGNKVVDTDEQKLAGQSQQIEDLRNQLRDVWPPHELTRQEESVLVNAVTSMVGHSPLLSIPVLISMMSALVYISYAYTGWNAASYLAGEVERPQQEMPRAILLGTGLVLLLYLSLNCVYALALPAAEVRRIVEDPSNRQGVDAVAPIAQLAVERLLGVKLSDPLSVAIGLTLLASLSAYILTGPRVAYAMAQTGQFPAIAGRLSSRNGTPVIATGLQSAWSLVLLWTGSFEMILLYSGVGLALFSMITVSAVYVLRWRRPDLPRPFRTPGYPVVPAIYLALTGLLVAAVFWERPLVSFLSLLSILAGIPLYGLWLWLSPRSERPV
jgi:APA family basic amino acid/polyamine antiporter